MKTIIVATDFSPASMNAVNYAADMSMTIGADILLLHVYQLPLSYSEAPVVMNFEEVQHIAEKDINDIRKKIMEERNGKLVVSTEVRAGSFFNELKAVCERVNPYTVVMGSQGTTSAERLFLGGHAVHAMKNLSWPLITVPAGASFSAVKKIGLACDFHEVIDTTPVEEIKMLSRDFNASVHVLNTGKKNAYDPEIVFQSGMLQEILAPLKPEYHLINDENTDAGIMDFAEKNNIDLLIVLPKRHSLMDQLIHKSHTKQFVLHSHVPVMALH